MSTQIVSPSPLANTIMIAPRAGLATIRTILSGSAGAGSNKTRRHSIAQTSAPTSFPRIDSSIFSTMTLAGTLSPMRSNSVSTATTTAAERYGAAVERELQELQDYQLSTVNDRGYFIPPTPTEKGFKENMKELEGDFFEKILLQTPPERVGNLLSVNSTISPGMFSDPVHSSVRRKIKGRGGYGATAGAVSRHQSIPSTFTRQTSMGFVPVTVTAAATAAAVDEAQQKRAPRLEARTTRTQEGQAALAKNIPSTKIATTTTPAARTADNLSILPSSNPPVQTPNKEQTLFQTVTTNNQTPSSSLPTNLSRTNPGIQVGGGGRQLTAKEIESKKSRHRARAQLSFLTGSNPRWGGLDMDNEDDEDMMNYGYDHSDVLFKKEASTSRTAAFLSDDILDSLLFSSTPSSTRSSSPPDLVIDSSSASSSAASSPEVSPRTSSSGQHHRRGCPEKELTRQVNTRKLKASNDFGGVLKVA